MTDKNVLLNYKNTKKTERITKQTYQILNRKKKVISTEIRYRRVQFCVENAKKYFRLSYKKKCTGKFDI